MKRPITLLNPPSVAPIAGLASHVAIAEAGRLAFIAGQVSTAPDGSIIAPGDFAGQVPAVFDNLGRILGDLGAGFTDVVEFTTYLVGEDKRAAWFEGRSRVFERLFPGKVYPPNTLLIISGLARAEYLLEVSAIVRLPDKWEPIFRIEARQNNGLGSSRDSI
jgi:enamine deaminase RidA (YjgF/YER057c/UK114 family)